MKTIAHRKLRNDSSEVLRQAEAGERFVITVQGRAVAEVLGPFPRRGWVPASAVRELLATPTDPDLHRDLKRLGRERLDDPWRR